MTGYIYIHINLHGTFCVQRKRHVFFVHSSCNYFFFSFFPSHFVVWKRKEKKLKYGMSALFFSFFLFPGVFNCDESVKVAVCTKG